jgi:hypothetical protein
LRFNYSFWDNGFDDAEDRLDGLFGQGIRRAAAAGLQTVRHALRKGHVCRRGRWPGEALRLPGVKPIAFHRDQRFDPGGFAGVRIGYAEIACVGQALLGPVQPMRQGRDALENQGHRLFVVGW